MPAYAQQRAQARVLVRQALARGELVRPAACESCRARVRIEAHHADYSRPLDVRWLCRLCHSAEHASDARLAASAELRADPFRSNRLIASLIGCDHHAVARARLSLERSGQIEPTSKRTPRFPPGPRALGRAQQAVLELGPAATTREVMELSGVGRNAAWKARRYPRNGVSGTHVVAAPDVRRRTIADSAAALDVLTVVRTQAPRSTRFRTGSTPPQGYYREADEIELECPACTLEWTPDGWQHDRACPARALAAR